MPSPHLDTAVRIAPRFRRSIHLEADFGQPDALAGYVVSPLARDVLARIVQGLATSSGGRAWTLVGPYGSGKSSFATLLASVLAHGDAAAGLPLFADQWPDAAPELRHDLAAIGGTLVPVLITGERVSIAHAVLRGLSKAARAFWSGRGATPSVVARMEDALHRCAGATPPSAGEVAELVVECTEKVAQSAQPGAGICLVIDEMGKLLEWAAQHPRQSDIYLLQLLAEAAARQQQAKLLLVTVLHQSIDAYAAGLPRATRLEWAKIEGRFSLVPYLEPPRHLLRLVAGALESDNSGLPLATRHRTVCEQLANLLGGDASFENDLRDAFPLHPVTAYCLGPLFRTRIGQNERSLFAFLASHEPLGFQEYLRKTEGGTTDRLFAVDYLYDYLLSNTMVRVAATAGERTWGAAEQALRRLPAEAPALDARIIKVVAVLSVVAKHLDLSLDFELLAITLDASTGELQEALQRLEHQSLLVYRRFKSSYQIWDGSDLNVAELVDKARQAVQGRGGLAAALQELLRPYPVIATRHYIAKGTLRFLMPRFSPVPSETATPAPGQKGDGDLYYIVPDRVEELDGLDELLGQPSLSSSPRPVVFAPPNHPQQLLDAAFEYFAVVEAQAATPELAADPVATRELEERRLGALDVLHEAIDRAYGSPRAIDEAKWYYRGEVLSVRRRHSAAASAIFDRAYPHAPHVLNELVNREQPSSAAAAARREVMERMFTHGGEARLGIEGSPPELSVYLSVLSATGLHRHEGDHWGIGGPLPGSAFENAWRHIDEHLSHRAGQRVRIDQIYALLARPPIGLRSGIAPMLVLSYYMVHRDRLFLYEDNSFARSPGDDMVMRLLKRPATFELQALHIGGTLGRVVESVARALGISAQADIGASQALVRVIQKVLKVIANLSPYAAQTHRLPTAASRLRSAGKAARDPIKLVLVDLPVALGLGRMDEEEPDLERAKLYATELNRALTELQAADSVLLDHVEDTTARLLGAASGGTAFRADLASRAQAVEGALDMLPQVGRFVSMTAAMQPTDSGSRLEWLQGLGTTIVGKPPFHWKDSDVLAFEAAAVGLTRSFLATEQLVLELHEVHHDSVHILRIAVLDSTGRERSRVAALRASELDRVADFKSDVLELAKRHGLTAPEALYASIASMADALPDEETRPLEEAAE